MPYRVLLDIKGQWWSDQKQFPTFNAARNHRKVLAQRWDDCATAIAAPDSRVLAWNESVQFQKEIAKLKKEA